MAPDRALRLIALALALLLAAGSGLNLLGDIYAEFAERHLDRATDESTLRAAALAARLTPWSAQRQGLHGWVLTERRQAAEAAARYQAALRWAPADALLWTEYTQALSRGGWFDASLLLATERAQQLAPSSPAIQGSIAETGISYWRRGSPEQRELWLRAMRYERDHNRNAFLERVLLRGQARTFCAGAAQRLDETAWCAFIQKKFEECRRAKGGGEDDALCVSAS